MIGMNNTKFESEAARHAEFTTIRYAQVWEDADVLLEALDIQPDDECASIASAGDNAFAMLSRGPRRVVALVAGLRPVFWWDRLYLGGGNSRLITPSALDALGDDVVVVPNSAALVGGARAWHLPLM